MAESFKQLEIWKNAMDLTLHIYKTTRSFPHEEKHGLISQMNRSAVSIPSNIAEGSGRHSRKESIHFYLIARGSMNELLTELILSKELGLMETKEFESLEQKIEMCGKLLNGLIRYNRNKSNI